jgi:hypothetical protein
MCRWDTIQNVFYRKDEVYTMAWRVPDLSDYLVTAAKNGGPIGMSFNLTLRAKQYTLGDMD